MKGIQHILYIYVHVAEKYSRKEEAFDRDVLRVRGQKFNSDPTKVNGYTNGHGKKMHLIYLVIFLSLMC